METYAKMGASGAFLSVDVTHFKWACCPVGLSNKCNGKEGFPTLAYQARVTHARVCRSLSSPFYGASNDIIISHYDPIMVKMKNKTIYQDVTFKIYWEDGSTSLTTGIYIIVDGGYIKYDWLINPMAVRSGMKEVYWSEFMESIRKDVECFNSAIKNRFRATRHIEYHHIDQIDNMIVTAVILHNMLLIVDGLDNSRWEQDVDWENLNPDDGLNEDDEDNDDNNDVVEVLVIPPAVMAPPLLDVPIIIVHNNNNNIEVDPAIVIARHNVIMSTHGYYTYFNIF